MYMFIGRMVPPHGGFPYSTVRKSDVGRYSYEEPLNLQGMNLSIKKSSSTDLNLSLNHRTSLSEFGIYLKYRTL